jgi:IstB-like ATP binding protein
VAIATLVEAGYRGDFTNAEEMVAHINLAVREGTLGSKLTTYTAPTILLIDDVGLLPMERGAASAFDEVINQRYENQRSTLVTTNRSLPDWGEIFGDTVVSAILEPADAQRRRVQHQRPILAAPPTPRTHRRHHHPHRKETELTSPRDEHSAATFDDHRTRISLIAHSTDRPAPSRRSTRDSRALVRHTPTPSSREAQGLIGAPQLGPVDGD